MLIVRGEIRETSCNDRLNSEGATVYVLIRGEKEGEEMRYHVRCCGWLIIANGGWLALKQDIR